MAPCELGSHGNSGWWKAGRCILVSGELGAVVEAELRGHWMPGLTLTGIDEVSIAIAAT